MRVLNWIVLAVLLFLFASLAALLYMQYTVHGLTIRDTSSAEYAETALVPGTSIIGTSTLSQVLKDRADGAVALYRGGKVKKILVTGDNSALTHDEVDPVGRYLLRQGIPIRDIFLDHAGFDTYSSLYRARDVFLVHSAIIVSQPFHLTRALFIARMLGLHVQGLEVTEEGTFIFNSLREAPASLKALIDLSFGRTPLYLGTTLPISGDGRETWVGLAPSISL